MEVTKNIVQKNVKKFCTHMNEKAKELNMVDSVFNDPAGVENYSTARDILNCLIIAANTEIIFNIFSQEKAEIKIKGSNEREMAFESATLMGKGSSDLRDYYNVICGKGGTLNIPKIFNLSVIVQSPDDNRRLACVVMNALDPSTGTKNRFAATRQAIDIATSTSEEKDICAKSAIVCVMPENTWEDPKILYKKNPREIIRPASMSKMLTAIIVLEFIKDIHTEIHVKQEIIDMIPDKFYQNDFKDGDIVSARDLISAMFLPSSNAAAYILANFVGEMIR